MAREKPPLSIKGFAQPLHAYEVQGLRSDLVAPIIRRDSEGVRIMIDLSRNDRQKALHVLNELIGEINGGAERLS